jgi:SagB-type dehydrogenase family enzyme
MSVREKIAAFVTLMILLSLLGIVYGLSAGRENSQNRFSAGETFHHETRLTWRRVIGDVLSFKPEKPPQYKTYPEAKKIQLPDPDYRGMTVEEAIKKRRSVRNYSTGALSMNQLSQLLFAAQGITGKMYGQPLRSAPSAGALYPFELYLVVNNVKGLSSGIYHYDVLNHAIVVIKSGDFSDHITDAGLKQDMLGEADVTFVLASIFDRVRHKYGERGYRYAYIEAGHISQNIYLQAVSLGLGSVSVGAFLDDKVNQLIGVDGQKEAAIYLHAIGTL